jgi:hypothetical protein
VITQIVEVLVYDFFFLKIKTFAKGFFNINQIECHKAKCPEKNTVVFVGMFTFIISKGTICLTFLIAKKICDKAPPTIRLTKKFRSSAVIEEFFTVVVNETN